VKPHNSQRPVVLLANGVTALGVLRAFARQGIPTYVHPDSRREDLRLSRWYRPLLAKDQDTPLGPPSASALADALQRSNVEQAFLCAGSDEWQRIVAEFSERNDPRFVCVVASRATLDTLQDKAALARLLQRLGVPMPATRVVNTADDVADLPQTNDTFYFLKPTDSQHFFVRFGVKGFRVRSAAEARTRLDEILAAKLGAVLQEYIPGSFTEHHFVDGYVDRTGAIKALFARRRVRIYPPDFGNSSAMISIPLQEVCGAVDSVRRVFEAVSYRGIFSAEFKRDPRDGLFKLLEINTRPWWFIDFAVRCGVDVCRMAYDDAQGQPVPAVSEYKVGATCIYPYYDFFAVQPLLRAGSLSWWRWASELMRAYQPVGCWDDPLPGIAGFIRVTTGALRRRLFRRWP
jgi:predicted ATP-grasp superfamily ATP-dependent carboligase